MRVIVIGGAGYIGSHVVREFLDSGHEVTVYDNFSSGARENLFPEAALVEGDILDPKALVAAMRGHEAAVHLAAFKAVGESMANPEKYSVNNIGGTLNILNAMSEAGCKRIVFSSSAAVFGEPKYLPIDEKHPTEPESYYGFTKLEIERFLAWYDRLRGIRYSVLRYFNATGYDAAGRVKGLERNPANLIPAIMEVAMGWRDKLLIFGNDYPTRDGTGVRDYVHVSDLAAAHVQSLRWVDEHDRSLSLNLGSGEGLSVLEILESARRITGREIKAEIVGRRPGDPAQMYATSALARESLGWSAAHSDVDTLVRTSWDAYKNRKAKP